MCGWGALGDPVNKAFLLSYKHSVTKRRQKQYDQQTCVHVIYKQNSVFKQKRGEMLEENLMNCSFHH